MVNPHVQAVQNMCGKGGYRVFQTELGAAEVYPIFKKKLEMWCQKNRYGLNFQNIASKTNQRGLIVYEPTLIQFGADILKIVAVLIFLNGS